MKSLLLLILAFFATQFCYAQWQYGTNNNPAYLLSGNVGIGTGNPQSLLNIKGGSSYGMIRLNPTTDNGEASIGFNVKASEADISNMWVLGAGAWSSPGKFIIGNSVINGPVLSILSNGNLGINTVNPDQRLHVEGNIHINDKMYFGNWTLGATGQWPTNPGLYYQGGDETFGFASTGGQISIQIDGAFRQQEVGKVNYFMDKVGIGTMAPSTSAEIVGADGNHRASSKSDYQLLIRSQDDPVNPYIGIGYRQDNGVTEYGQIQSFNDFNGGYATSLILNARGGNVGIGTTSPDQQLTVNGTIHGSEVKVDTSIPVPDYVFDSSYKLTDLATLQDYLNKYHHLPEIPSASQIQKEGLKLGEMNTLLLKKVEELTLYLIEKDKQISELNKEKAKSAEQQKKIDALETKLNTLLQTLDRTK